MEIWKAAVLGIVQGLTEFLPVSSSGHIILFEKILGIHTGGADMFLGIMLHAGTLCAVLAVYFKKLLALFKRPFGNLLKLAIATLPAALVGVLLGDLVDRVFFGGRFLWIAFALTALLLALAENKSKQSNQLYYRRQWPLFRGYRAAEPLFRRLYSAEWIVKRRPIFPF